MMSKRSQIGSIAVYCAVPVLSFGIAFVLARDSPQAEVSEDLQPPTPQLERAVEPEKSGHAEREEFSVKGELIADASNWDAFKISPWRLEDDRFLLTDEIVSVLSISDGERETVEENIRAVHARIRDWNRIHLESVPPRPGKNPYFAMPVMPPELTAELRAAFFDGIASALGEEQVAFLESKLRPLGGSFAFRGFGRYELRVFVFDLSKEKSNPRPGYAISDYLVHPETGRSMNGFRNREFSGVEDIPKDYRYLLSQ